MGEQPTPDDADTDTDTDEPDVSDDWTVTTYFVGPNNTRPKTVIEHSERGAMMIVKLLASGTARLALCIPDTVPGGYDEVDHQTFAAYDNPTRNLAAAIQEAGRRGAQYDTEGTWLIEGAPVLH